MVALSYDADAIVRGEVIFHPVDFSLIGYESVFKYKELGLDYPLTDVPPLARERIEAIKKRFEGIFPC